MSTADRVYRTGTITLQAGKNTVTATGTAFLNEVAAGDVIITAGMKVYSVASVTNDTALIIDGTATVNESGVAYAAIRFATARNVRDLMIKIEEFLTQRQANLVEFTAWMTGTATGGPNKDGKYPLTDRFGNVTMALCPAALDSGKQNADPLLTALAGLTTAADQMIYSTGPDAFAMTSLTQFMRSLLDDIDAPTARATLGAAPLKDAVLTGDPKAPTPTAGDKDTSLATTDFVHTLMRTVVYKDVAGGAGVTLTAQEAGTSLIIFQGALTANISVTFPSINGQWIVINRTTGAFTLTIKAKSDDAGMVIGQNRQQLVFSNAANFFPATNELINAVLLGAPTAVTPALGDNSTRVQTTAGATAQLADLGIGTTQGPLYVFANVADWAKPGGWGGFVNFAGSVNTPGGMTSGYGYYRIVAKRDAAGGYGGILITHGTDGTSGDLWFCRSSSSTVAPAWRRVPGADQLATVATSGQFSDLAATITHWMIGRSAANAYKTVVIQNLEATGSASLEVANSNGYFVNTIQAVNDQNGGWRPRHFYTKSGSQTADRRTYWMGVNDSDIIEFAGYSQVRIGSFVADQTGAALCIKGDASDGTQGLTINNFAPSLAMVDRTAGAYSSRWRTDGDNLALDFDNANNGATWGSTVLNFNRTGEIRSLYANNYRIISGNYGTFWRNDGSTLYLMLTNSGDAWGNWNSLRPFSVNLATGKVAMSNGLEVLTVAVGTSSNDAASTSYVRNELAAYGLAGGAATNYSTVDLGNAPVGSYVRAEGPASNASTYGWPDNGATGTTQVAYDVQTFGVAGSGSRIVQMATEIFGSMNNRGRTFVRVKHDTTWYAWAELLQMQNVAGTANQVVVTTTAGKMTLALPQNIHTGATPTFANIISTNAPTADGHVVNKEFFDAHSFKNSVRFATTGDLNQSAATATTMTGKNPTVNATGTTTSGSTTLSGLNIAAQSELKVGAAVTGSGIPNGATVATIVSNNSVTLSAAATASATVALTFNQSITALNVDGANPATGDRILVKDQTFQPRNGIYLVTNTGSTTAAWVLTRAPDGTTWNDLVKAVIPVEEGSVNNHRMFMSVTTQGGTVGSTSVAFQEVLTDRNAGSTGKALLGAADAATARTTLGLAGGAIKDVSTPSAVRDRLAYIDAGGVMEIGGYIDMHVANNDGLDFAGRLAISNGVPLWVNPNIDQTARQFFTQHNIVGPVGYVGSYPSGSIVERGSNSTGNYTRFADGTQICWGTIGTQTQVSDSAGGVGYHKYIGNGVFAAAFADTPTVTYGVNQQGSYYGLACADASTSSTQTGSTYLWSPSNTFKGQPTFFAVGRWR